jgi:isopenicillin-N epimerase
MDPSADLSVPAAIDFQEQHQWGDVRAACHRLALETQARILDWSGFSPLAPATMRAQMVADPIPGAAADYAQMWEEFGVEVPILEWNGQTLVRVSVQAYTRPDHIDRLLHALATLHARR